jgi:hypothetical protein
MGKSKVQKSNPIKSTEPKFTIVRLDYVKSKRASNSLSKLALSNALVQNANKKTINIPTKMFNSLFSETTETSILPIDLLRILLCEGKEPSSFVVIVDDVAKEVKTQNKKHPKPPKVFTQQSIIINTCSDKGVTTRSLDKS